MKTDPRQIKFPRLKFKAQLRETLIGAGTGLALALIIALLSWIRWGPMDAVSVFTTDLLFSSGGPSEEVVIVALDDRSVAELGDWPLPRDSIAKGITRVTQDEPKAIGIDLVFASENDDSPQRDAALIEAVSKARKVVLGQAAFFEGGVISDVPIADYITRPFEALAEATCATAHLNVYEIGSRVPEIPPVIGSADGDSYMFALQLFAVAEGIDLSQARYEPGESLSADGLDIPLGPEGGVIVNYQVGYRGFETFSLIDVLDGKVPAGAFTGKVVLFGPYWQGAKDAFLTPLGEMYGIEIQGNVVESLIHRDFISYMPDWLMFTGLLIGGLFMGVLLSILKLWHGALLLSGSLILIVLAWAWLSEDNFLRFITPDSQRLFFDLPYPVATVLLVFGGVSGRKYYLERGERRRIASTFGRFVTPQVLEEILKSEDEDLRNPKGALQEITVLFMDIRGYTTIAEKLPAEEVFDLLNNMFSRVTEVFTRHQGTINKFIGDAVMVIFNAPLPQTDHALRAVRAAWEAQEAVRSIDSGSEIRITCGIGINTGMAMVGTIGSGSRMEYTCIGDTVNIAARLEGQAKDGIGIVIGPGTYQYVQHEVEARPLPETFLKGKEATLQIYEVTSPFRKQSDTPLTESDT